MSLSAHQTTGATCDEWLTPPEIIRALGVFDLDPCAPATRPWPTALHHYTVADNGLAQDWWGRVWLNPPYDRHIRRWLERLATHDNGIALVAARTETKHWHSWVWPKASAILFMQGRPHFHYVDGRRAPFNSGAPIVLIAYGAENAYRLETSGIAGKVVRL
jgi:hypothetical protein